MAKLKFWFFFPLPPALGLLDGYGFFSSKYNEIKIDRCMRCTCVYAVHIFCAHVRIMCTCTYTHACTRIHTCICSYTFTYMHAYLRSTLYNKYAHVNGIRSMQVLIGGLFIRHNIKSEATRTTRPDQQLI